MRAFAWAKSQECYVITHPQVDQKKTQKAEASNQLDLLNIANSGNESVF